MENIKSLANLRIDDLNLKTNISQDKIEFEELIKDYRNINIQNFNLYIKDLWKVSPFNIIGPM
jgi:hypothetical protein